MWIFFRLYNKVCFTWKKMSNFNYKLVIIVMEITVFKLVVCPLCNVSIYLKLYTLIDLLLMFVLQIRLYDISVCSCINNNFLPI